MGRKQVFEREEIINLVQAQYELLSKKKKNSPSVHALVSDRRGGDGGRGCHGGKRGGQGGGRGNSGKNGCTKKDKKSGNGGDAAEAEKQPAKGPICFNCRGRGHFARDCTVKTCKRCHGIGHEESSCSSPADMQAVLAVELPVSDSDSDTNFDEVAAALMAMELKEAMFGHLQQAVVVPGESVGGGPIGGVAGILALKAGEGKEGWCFDSGSSGHVTYDSAKMTNNRP